MDSRTIADLANIQSPDQTGLSTIHLLAQLDIVVDVSALDGLTHDRGLSNPRLQLPLGGQVDYH